MSSLIFRITYNAVLTPKAASSNMTNSRLLKTWVLVNRFLLLICKRYVGYHKSFCELDFTLGTLVGELSCAEVLVTMEDLLHSFLSQGALSSISSSIELLRSIDMRGTTREVGKVLVTLGSWDLGGGLVAGDHGDGGQVAESVLKAGLVAYFAHTARGSVKTSPQLAIWYRELQLYRSHPENL